MCCGVNMRHLISNSSMRYSRCYKRRLIVLEERRDDMDEMFVRLICAMLRELDRLSSDYQVLQDSVAVGEVERQRRSKEVRNVGSRTKVLFKVLSDVGALEEVNGV